MVGGGNLTTLNCTRVCKMLKGGGAGWRSDTTHYSQISREYDLHCKGLLHYDERTTGRGAC